MEYAKERSLVKPSGECFIPSFVSRETQQSKKHLPPIESPVRSVEILNGNGLDCFY